MKFLRFVACLLSGLLCGAVADLVATRLCLWFLVILHYSLHSPQSLTGAVYSDYVHIAMPYGLFNLVLTTLIVARFTWLLSASHTRGTCYERWRGRLTTSSPTL